PMYYPAGFWESIRDCSATGCGVWFVIMGARFCSWDLMIEPFWFFTSEQPALTHIIFSKCNAHSNSTYCYAHNTRDAWVSEAADKLNARSLLSKTCVALCPLIGLLGTVTGMITVFEIMAVRGTGNPRLMASGISMATIPTMAGMVAALSGMYFATRLEARVRKAKNKLIDSLPHH